MTLGGYKPGYAPVLLVNNTATYHIEYGEAGSDTLHTLFPGIVTNNNIYNFTDYYEIMNQK